MKTKQNFIQFLAVKLYCKIFGHRLKVSNEITEHIREYECKNCGQEMTDTANGLLAKLTPKFRETNEFLAHFYQKRNRKRYSEAS